MADSAAAANDLSTAVDLTSPNTLCWLDNPNAMVDGNPPPSGMFAGRYAWFGFQKGDCFGWRVVIAAQSPLTDAFENELTFILSQPLTDQFVDGTYTPDGTQFLSASGMAQVPGLDKRDSTSPAPLDGTFSVKGTTSPWTESGSFHAYYCQLLDESCVGL